MSRVARLVRWREPRITRGMGLAPSWICRTHENSAWLVSTSALEGGAMMRSSMRAIRPTGIALALTGLLVAGCALGPVSDGSGSPQPSGGSSGVALERITEQDAARLRA